jgi:hypothetical protein
MRVGLLGTMRRVWGRRGAKVRQRLQLVREWRYLHLVVDPLAGRLWWFWSHTMQAPVTRTLVDATRAETELAALVWDRAPIHRDATVHTVGLPLIEQPPYAPELNPVERVFEHLRAGIEGKVYQCEGRCASGRRAGRKVSQFRQLLARWIEGSLSPVLVVG